MNKKYKNKQDKITDNIYNLKYTYVEIHKTHVKRHNKKGTKPCSLSALKSRLNNPKRTFKKSFETPTYISGPKPIHNGKSLKERCRICGLIYSTTWARINRQGIPEEEIFKNLNHLYNSEKDDNLDN